MRYDDPMSQFTHPDKLTSKNSPANEPKPGGTKRVPIVSRSPPPYVGVQGMTSRIGYCCPKRLSWGSVVYPTGGARLCDAKRGRSDRMRGVRSSATTRPSSRRMVRSHRACTISKSWEATIFVSGSRRTS